MNPLITITTQIIDNEEMRAVNARDLHRALMLKKDFSNWIKAQIKSLELEEDIDYASLTQKGEREIGATRRIDYILTLDAAKHIAMASRSARGKEVRRYFIAVEREWRRGAVRLPVDAMMTEHTLLDIAGAVGRLQGELTGRAEHLEHLATDWRTRADQLGRLVDRLSALHPGARASMGGYGYFVSP